MQKSAVMRNFGAYTVMQYLGWARATQGEGRPSRWKASVTVQDFVCGRGNHQHTHRKTGYWGDVL